MNDLNKILGIYDIKVNVNCVKDDDISFLITTDPKLSHINVRNAIMQLLRYTITEFKRLKIYLFKINLVPYTLKRDVIIVLTVANTFMNHMISFQGICIELKG